MDGIDKNESKKNERSLFKKCFKNPMFSLVPFEIWRDLIVSNADLKTITLLSQACFAFKHLVDDIGKNFNLALMLRKEGQIGLAKKYLLKCVDNNNSTAILHLAYAYFYGGWGLRQNDEKSIGLFKKSAEAGNPVSMAYFSLMLNRSIGIPKDENNSKFWGNKAFHSNNQFAKGLCYFWEIGPAEIDRFDLAVELMESSNDLQDGDEFAQYMFGRCFYSENNWKGFVWYHKSAKQGNAKAQYQLAHMYQHGVGCEQDNDKAVLWGKKAIAQGIDDYASILALKAEKEKLKNTN